jgi:HlyD family secretion protein
MANNKGKHSFRRIFLALLTIAAGLVIWWLLRPKPLEVVVTTVDQGPVERTVANTRAGTIKACRRAHLSPAVGGQIDRLPFREGDEVKPGELLLELWNQDLLAELELAEREAESQSANANATCLKAGEALRDANRKSTLRQRKLVSEEIADRAATEAKATAAECLAAKQTLAVRQAKINVVKSLIEKTRLKAPFAGVVAKINGELNEYVTPSPPGIPTPPAVDLIEKDCFYVAAPIDEVDVAAIALGMAARITLDAFGEREFEGRVRRIADYVLDVEKQARTVDVEVAFARPEDIERLLAGYSADVEIILEVHANTLRVPTEAVLEGDRVYVFDPESGRVGIRQISRGIANWDFTEVAEGLAAGDLIVTSIEREGLADGVAARAEASGNL